ncbi:hypothetical protein [Absidia glauca]|uniref:Uncharacterized protein n=1 Tax=Absidia glauca TaxID=4829 RepID=A0A168RMD2_ABSGL|nr:hypothetical protein [Absidia glauca]
MSASTANAPKILFACYLCQDHKTFSDRTRLRRHLANSHQQLRHGAPQGRPPKGSAEFPPVKGQILFSCPCCFYCHDALEQIAIHVETHPEAVRPHMSEDDEDDEGNDSGSDGESSPIVTIPAEVTVPDNAEIKETNSDNRKRNQQESVLFACHEENADLAISSRTEKIVHAMDLIPFSLVGATGTEYNALAHPAVIEKLAEEKDLVAEKTEIKKRKLNETEMCNNCSELINVPANLEIQLLMARSPYFKVLRLRQFVELTKELCDLVNQDWTFHPHIKYVTAQLLAGSILRNSTTGATVMINTIEAYGRKKGVDPHREPFGTKKLTTMRTSLPPPFKTKYPNVWPTTLDTTEGQKLVIGTLSSNCLVTSVSRLDQPTKPSVGAITTVFTLCKISESLATTIYIDQESLEKALSLAKQPDAVSTSGSNLLGQLRQVRTKFHLPSTYHLCRSSGPITITHECQPYSLATIDDFDRGRSPAAQIFSNIAINVLKLGTNAVIKKALIEQLVAKSKGKAKTLLQQLVLVLGDKEEVPVLGNTELNEKLEDLAAYLGQSITKSNNSVSDAILRSFTYFDH